MRKDFKTSSFSAGNLCQAGLSAKAAILLLGVALSGCRLEIINSTAEGSETNEAPAISAISSQSILHSFPSDPISFTVSDAESDASDLTVSVSSSDSSLLPASGVSLSGVGGARTLVLTPAPNVTGTAEVTISASDGARSASRSFAVTVHGVDLEVPLTAATGVYYSQTSSYIADATQMSLDPSAYDGTLSFSFEIVGRSTDTVDRTVELVDSAGVTRASVTLPASSGWGTRVRAAWTPNASADTYRVRLPATSSSLDINLSDVRILVRQANATRTRLWIPLIVTGATLSGELVTAGTSDKTTSTTFTQYCLHAYPIWQKNSAAFDEMAATNPWTFEAVLSSSSALGAAEAALYNRTTGNPVTGGTLSATGTSVQLVSTSLQNNAVEFTELNDFELRIRSNNSSYTARVYRAGIWLTIDRLRKGEVFHGLGSLYGGTAPDTAEGGRALIDLSLFSEAAVAFEATSYMSTAGVASYHLLDHGVNDAGVAGALSIAGSSAGVSTSKARVRSGPLSITSGNRYFLGSNVSSGTLQVQNAGVVVSFGY